MVATEIERADKLSCSLTLSSWCNTVNSSLTSNLLVIAGHREQAPPLHSGLRRLGLLQRSAHHPVLRISNAGRSTPKPLPRRSSSLWWSLQRLSQHKAAAGPDQKGKVTCSSQSADLILVIDFDIIFKAKRGDPKQQQRGQERSQGKVYDAAGTAQARPRRAPMAVDEDLYKIPPELLHEKPRRVNFLPFPTPPNIFIHLLCSLIALRHLSPEEDGDQELVVKLPAIKLQCMRRNIAEPLFTPVFLASAVLFFSPVYVKPSERKMARQNLNYFLRSQIKQVSVINGNLKSFSSWQFLARPVVVLHPLEPEVLHDCNCKIPRKE